MCNCSWFASASQSAVIGAARSDVAVCRQKWVGSPVTTVSFDHGTFDHGHWTTGQKTTNDIWPPRRKWYWTTGDIWPQKAYMTFDRKWHLTAGHLTTVTFDHKWHLTAGHLTAVTFDHSDIWPRDIWPQVTFDRGTFDRKWHLTAGFLTINQDQNHMNFCQIMHW